MLIKRLTFLLFFISQPAFSDWDLAVSVGYGQRNNPLIQSELIETLVNIDVAWYGERLFFDNGDFGATLASNQHWQLNLVAQINNERTFFSKTNTRFVTLSGSQVGTNNPPDPVVNPDDGLDSNPPTSNPGTGDEGSEGNDDDSGGGRDDDDTPQVTLNVEVPDRNFALESGLEAIYSISDRKSLYAAVLTDVSNQHNGTRAYLSYQQHWLHGRWFTHVNTGIKWQDENINTYYFGVTQEEASSQLKAYSSESGANYYGSVLFSYAIAPRWFWGTRLAYEQLADAIADSTIVDNDAVYTVFTGIKYQF